MYTNESPGGIQSCGKQGIALRGHRDDHTCVDLDPLANHGNFMALLQFQIQAGDKVLSEHVYKQLEVMQYILAKQSKMKLLQYIMWGFNQAANSCKC